MSGFLLPLALSYLSWGLLCLGLPRHYRQHFGHEPAPRRRMLLRAGGWLVLVPALAPAVAGLGWGPGLVAWAAAWMLAALAWVLLHTYRPRLARVLLPALPILAALASLG